MESINSQETEGLEYYESAPTLEFWDYGSSVNVSNGHFSSETIMPSEFGSTGVDAWSALNYQQESSPSSVQSSMGRAPSTNTSYNEIDSRDSVSTDLVHDEAFLL
jgi:hypothetical protein